MSCYSKKKKNTSKAAEGVFLGSKRKPAGDVRYSLMLRMSLYDIARLADLDPNRSAEKAAEKILLDYLEKNKTKNSF